MIRFLSALILMFIVSIANAGELHLQLHGISQHDKPRTNGKPWNEKNYGAGLRYQFDEDWGVQGGAYRNSYDRQSKYLMLQYTPLHLGAVHVGTFAGYVDGYGLDYPLGAGVMATVQGDRLSLTARLVPKTKWGHATALSLELGFRFGSR